MTRTTPPYEQLALIWDQMKQDRHSVNMVSYCQKIFERFNIRPATGLDLCCGTGTAVDLLSDLGIQMSGADMSAAMLAVAAKKLQGRKVPLHQKILPRFRLLDIHDSTKTQQFDLITCFYDSLNYMTTKSDLQMSFRTVYRHLEPGGWFIFDMNTPNAMQTIWSDQVYADARDDLAWVWKGEFFPKRQMAACHATCFYRKSGQWLRFDETHWERGYENEDIRMMLEKARFDIRGFYKCHTFRKPGKNTYRIAVVAHKR